METTTTWAAIIKSTLMLFAIVNPIGSVPLFLQLTSRLDSEERKQAFGTAIRTSAIILLVFVIAGEKILSHLFQITLNDLMAAGGLLLLIIAIDHLVFGSLVRGVMSGEGKEARQIGAVPIACPMLAGPGAMMSVLVTYSEHGFRVAIVSMVVVLGATWLILRFIDPLYRFLGETVCTVLSKILCLFLAAVGIRLMMQGLSVWFQG
ncbi:MarC family protein [Planctomycetota bacterium]